MVKQILEHSTWYVLPHEFCVLIKMLRRLTNQGILYQLVSSGIKQTAMSASPYLWVFKRLEENSRPEDFPYNIHSQSMVP